VTESFQLPVNINNEAREFEATLLNYGYAYKMEVDIEGTKVLFEPDEERNWRALISFEDLQANKKLDAELLRAVALAIESFTK
jgi:hypothetical protein